jgi:hypothetical protein
VLSGFFIEKNGTLLSPKALNDDTYCQQMVCIVGLKLRKGQAMSILDHKLTELIARDLNISPEEVTLESIHKWREEKLYPKAIYDFDGKYGGYHYAGLETLSVEEIEEIEKVSDDFLAQFATADAP